MKQFDKDGKINFVDENNVFAGFDNSSSCCESFGWLLTRDIPTKIENEDPRLADGNDYVFDVGYCNKSTITEDLDCGDSVTFKMYSKSNSSDVLYLTFFNCHNGYYGHGFEFKIGEEIKEEGCL